MLIFDKRSLSENLQKQLKLQQFSKVDLKLLGLDLSTDWLSVVWEKSEKDKSYLIKVKLSEDAPPGTHMAVLSVKFEQGMIKVIEVPVLVNVKGNDSVDRVDNL